MMITTLVWCERLLAIAILFQTMELLRLKSVWADSGIWRWDVVRRDYENLHPKVLAVLDFFLNEESFHLVLKIRIFCAVCVWFLHPFPIIAFLFFSTWLVAIRWRGIFNGGSDSMTALVALALTIAQFFSSYPILLKACLAYVAVQVTGSYFLAGLGKIKSAEWKNGTALSTFFKTPRYDSPPEWIKALMERPGLEKVISWSVILFQLAFPLAWLNSGLAMIFVSAGIAFHLINFWVFGLNRFVFAWMAAYPALLFWASRDHSYD